MCAPQKKMVPKYGKKSRFGSLAPPSPQQNNKKKKEKNDAKRRGGREAMYNDLNHFFKFIKFVHSLHGPNQESQENTCIQKDKVNFWQQKQVQFKFIKPEDSP